MKSLNPQILTDFITKYQSFVVIGHEFVDGDALGSMLGLGGILRALGKDVIECTTHTPGSVFDFLSGYDRVQTELDTANIPDAYIFVDFSPLDRIKRFAIDHTDLLLSRPLAIIDHHHEEKLLDGVIDYKDTSSIATCEIITERVKKSHPDAVNAQIATALLMGIMTDSGNFLFPCDYQRTFANVLRLLERGADKDLLVSKLFRSRRWGSVQFLQIVLQRAILSVPFAWTWIQKNEWEAYDIDKQEAKSGMNMVQGVEGVACTLMVDINHHNRKIHMRSKHTDNYRATDCQRIASFFGGGGHVFAAGATIDPSQTFVFEELSICPKTDGPTGLASFIEAMSRERVVK